MVSSAKADEGQMAAATDQAEQVENAPGGIAYWQAALIILACALVLDQATKLWAAAVLAPPPLGKGTVYTIIPDVFYLRFARNTGAAFSFMTGKTGLLAIISFIASILMGIWWTRLPAAEKWGRMALALVIGGAVGNLIDRIRLGYVIDFLDVYIGSYDYPVFNIADSVICIGVGILLLRTWRGHV